MTRQDALRLLEQTLDIQPHSLTGGETLRDLEGWDSMSTLAFIAMVDKELGQPLPGSRVVQCKTVDQLLELMGIASANRAA
ncbi:MAG TPA: acyl carrier protein [Gemmataceae bacterium]|jgi:acyl carrier protein